MRQHGRERDRDVELDVVRIAHRDRRDREERRRCQAGRAVVQPAAERVERRHRGDPAQRRQRPPGQEVARGIDEEVALESAERVEEPRDAPGHIEQPLPCEQDVEIQRRVHEVVGVGIALGERERAVQDRRFVRVVDRRQPVGEAEHPEAEREHADGCQNGDRVKSGSWHRHCGADGQRLPNVSRFRKHQPGIGSRRVSHRWSGSRARG